MEPETGNFLVVKVFIFALVIGAILGSINPSDISGYCDDGVGKPYWEYKPRPGCPLG